MQIHVNITLVFVVQYEWWKEEIGSAPKNLSQQPA